MKKSLTVVMLLLASMAYAQSDAAKKEVTLYKVEFSVMEVQNGQKSNVRNYSMFIASDGRMQSTRVGNRVPVPAGKDGGIQYMDVGLNLNCRVAAEKENAVVIDFNFDLGSLLPPDATSAEHVPVVRQLRQEGTALLPIGKATVISSADDINTTRTIVVEATATRIK
jgi:hypothetical protein